MTSNGALQLPRLFLIRHGDTEWTDSHRHTGLTDIPLNEMGESRAREMRTRLDGERFSRVFTSPLIRARRTCALAGFGGRAEENTNLLEWDYGEYDGRTTAQIHAARPEWALFHDVARGGETPEQVAARAERFLKIVRPIEGDVAAFSSGHIIRMIAARWLGLAPRTARCFFTGTASINILGYEHGRAEPVILLWNDTGPQVEKSK